MAEYRAVVRKEKRERQWVSKRGIKSGRKREETRIS